MRPLESALTVFAFYQAWPSLPGQFLVNIFCCALLLAHIIFEGARWQLSLLYAFVGTHTIYSLTYSGKAQYEWYTSVVIVVAIMLTSATACLMPVTNLPALTGPFKTIGTLKKYCIDSDHFEMPIYLQDHEDRKNPDYIDRPMKLAVRIFYPSSMQAPKTSQNRAYYMELDVARAIAQTSSLPGWLLSHLTLVRSIAIKNAPLEDSRNKLPVVIFSHGLSGTADTYTVFLQDLASHGYVVFAIDAHLDASAALAKTHDGNIIEHRGYSSVLKNGDQMARQFRYAQINRRQRELVFLLDYIEASERFGWREAVPFEQMLDLSRVAAVGHSFGSASVIQWANKDSRVKAIVAHDPWQLPLASDVIDNGIPQPLLVTVSDQFRKWNENWELLMRMFTACERRNQHSRKLVIEGSTHLQFCDMLIHSSWVSKQLGLAGTADSRRVLDILVLLQANFLNNELGNWIENETQGSSFDTQCRVFPAVVEYRHGTPHKHASSNQ